jgi:hypothetical protein
VDVNVLITSAQPSMLGQSQKVGTQITTSTAQTPKNQALDTCSLVLVAKRSNSETLIDV